MLHQMLAPLTRRTDRREYLCGVGSRAERGPIAQDGLKRLLAMLPESDRAIAPPISKNAKDATWRIAIDVRLQTNDLESRLQAVERMPSEGRGRSAQFIPYRFEFANKLTKNDKLLLAFDALLFSEAVGREVSLGKIMHGDSHATLKVKTLCLWPARCENGSRTSPHSWPTIRRPTLC